MKFDSDGKPSESYGQIPFTLAAFDMRKVKLSGNKLILEGNRVGLTFNEKGESHTVKLDKMRIEIDGKGNTDFTKALDGIFADGLAEITPLLPSYWQPYAHQRFVLNEPPADIKSILKDDNPAASENKTSENSVKHVGGTVKAPRLLPWAEPAFTEAARAQQYSANIRIYLWLGEDGVPSHLRIVRPAGLGLDEQALAWVQQYRFAPATRDGEPAKVDLYIEVNFKIW